MSLAVITVKNISDSCFNNFIYFLSTRTMKRNSIYSFIHSLRDSLTFVPSEPKVFNCKTETFGLLQKYAFFKKGTMQVNIVSEQEANEGVKG